MHEKLHYSFLILTWFNFRVQIWHFEIKIKWEETQISEFKGLNTKTTVSLHFDGY